MGDSDMTYRQASQIAFGMGVDSPLDPAKPKPRSLKYTMMRNACYVGYCYVSPDSPDPQMEALRIGKSHGCNEAWHGTPCDLEPVSYLCG